MRLFLTEASLDRWEEERRRQRGKVRLFSEAPFFGHGEVAIHISIDGVSPKPWCRTKVSDDAGHGTVQHFSCVETEGSRRNLA